MHRQKTPTTHLQSVAAAVASEECDFEIRNNRRAARHHAFNAQQLVDVLLKCQVAIEMQIIKL